MQPKKVGEKDPPPPATCLRKQTFVFISIYMYMYIHIIYLFCPGTTWPLFNTCFISRESCFYIILNVLCMYTLTSMTTRILI